jgi:hypothetical protein
MDYFELQKSTIFYPLNKAISTVSLYRTAKECFLLNIDGIKAAAILETNPQEIETQRIMDFNRNCY